MKITRTTATFSQSVLCLLLLLSGLVTVQAQTTQFTYQGRLTDSSLPANGAYDFQFALFNAVSAGTQVGSTVSLTNINVSSGNFTVTLDFGAGSFPGTSRFLEISVRLAGGGAFTTLSPRQPITATPYAVKSLTATMADGLSASCNGCVNSTQIGSLPVSSNSYIQNTTSQQANSNFNISGTGRVGGALVVGEASTSGRLYLTRATASAANSTDINFNTGVNPDFALGLSQGTAAATDFSLYNYGTGKNVLTVQKSSGYVGLGTTAPQRNLHISDSSANATALVLDNTTSGGSLLLLNYGSTGGGVFWTGLSSANTAAILTTKPLVLGANNGLIFSGSNGGEHLRITTNGTVLPGLDNAQNLGGFFARWSAVWAANGTIQTSDARLKKSITPLSYGLQQVMQLRPVSFQWKDHADGRTHLGLIAQDVEKLIPEAVAVDKDPAAPLGMSYTSLVPVLVRAIQEQQGLLQQQHAQLRQQQNEIKQLKQLVCTKLAQAAMCQ